MKSRQLVGLHEIKTNSKSSMYNSKLATIRDLANAESGQDYSTYRPRMLELFIQEMRSQLNHTKNCSKH